MAGHRSRCVAIGFICTIAGIKRNSRIGTPIFPSHLHRYHWIATVDWPMQLQSQRYTIAHFTATGCRSNNCTCVSLLQGFNIHINGTFHACLRYSQLHSLHDQLRRALPNFMLPPFPKKKLFLLNTGQLEERRASLERYIQLSRCFALYAHLESAI